MVKFKIFVEGGGKSHDLRVSCQEGFKKILEPFLSGSMPRIIARGSRNEVYDSFCIALKEKDLKFVAMLIDSEDPIKEIDKPWEHLRQRDSWDRPAEAIDDQVLFMTTCMETWIYAANLNTPVTTSLEKMDRHEVCKLLEKGLHGGYSKGKQSFQLLAKVELSKLENLPSFARVRRILDSRLRGNDATESR